MITIGEGTRAFHGVAKLADVARPEILVEEVLGVGLHLLHLHARSAHGLLTQEMFDQKRDVLAALPERRHGQGHDGDLVIKVLAELALANGFFQMGCAGSDKPELNRLAAAVATPGRALRLIKEAVELGLDAHRHQMDFCEVHGATV